MSNTSQFEPVEKTPITKKGVTPGPWELSGKVDESGQRTISGKGWVNFARVTTRMAGESEDCSDGTANANLIAAAPDLLKEMERMLVVIQRIEDELPATWAEATQGTGIATSNGYRVAINNAKGVKP